jgi:hypothetical protein
MGSFYQREKARLPPKKKNAIFFFVSLHSNNKHMRMTEARNMCRKFVVSAIVLLIVAILVASSGKAQGNENAPPVSSKPELTNKDILGMARAGLSSDIIIAKIQTSACIFDTSPSTLIELKSAGVPETVTLAMVKCSPPDKSQSRPTGIMPQGELGTGQQKEATPSTPKPQVTAKANLPPPQRLYVTGSARDVKMLRNALQLWTVGTRPCVQFIDGPEPGAYTLKFRWDQHYTLFVNSGTEADMDLYDSKGVLVWSEHRSVRSAGAYHHGHPEIEMYPRLYKALGCSAP